MTRNTPLLLIFGIIVFSLMTATAVYIFARVYPPDLLAPFQALNHDLSLHIGIFGIAPSFFYTLALGLVLGICACSRSRAILHCILWIALCLIMEISQHAAPSAWIAGWLPQAVPESIWNLFGPYWEQGVFDPIDLIATLIGGLIALILISRLPIERRNPGD